MDIEWVVNVNGQTCVEEVEEIQKENGKKKTCFRWHKIRVFHRSWC